MNAKKVFQRMILALGRVMPGVVFLVLTRHAEANPTGMTVQSGHATISVHGSTLTVTAGNNAFLNWQSFNIAQGQTTIFNQPSASSIVWNRINSGNVSQIYGTLQANGVVVLLNSSGFYFGPNSFVSAAGLVVSTADCAPPENSGGAWEFNGPPPLASIVNFGQIQIGNQGSCYLIADQVENHGTIQAPGGAVGLAAGKTVQLSERPDGRGMSMSVTLPEGSVDNYGTLIADAGTISLRAKVVNQDGLIQANSVRNVDGVIELVAGEELNLGADSKISASGDSSARGSAGGKITLKSDNTFSDLTGSEIITEGGSRGGNGGNVEISAPNVESLNTAIDARAQAKATAGKLLLDPDNIILDTTGTGSAGSGIVPAGNNPGTTLDLNVNTAFAKLAVSSITLQAADNLTLAAGTTWNLSQTIGSSLGGVTRGSLNLMAGGDILFGNGAAIVDAHQWSVNMDAGYDFNGNTIQSGIGNIYLNGGSGQAGNGSIKLGQGSANLNSGNSIVTGPGSQLTGGQISLNSQTIEQDGVVRANKFGSIELNASAALTFGAGSQTTVDAGSIVANAGELEQGGLVQANAVNNRSGSIMLVSGDSLAFESGSQTIAAGGNITANGANVDQGGLIEANASGSGPGSIALISGGELSFDAGSQTVADGGRISGRASQVDQNGLVQANAVQNHAGSIQLAAQGALNLNAGSLTAAQGGGVALQSADTLNINDGASVMADGGVITGTANEVNQSGTLQANSQQNQHGVIELAAADALTLGSTSRMLAKGVSSAGGSVGGNVTLTGQNSFVDAAGSEILTTGGVQGGNGGNVEINSPSINSVDDGGSGIVNSTIDESAKTGYQAGQFSLLGFANIELGANDGVLPDGSGTIDETAGSGTYQVNVNSAFQNITAGQILLETSGNITMDSGTWDLSGSTGNRILDGQLTLMAGGNISLADGALIQDANSWSVKMEAGYSWANGAVQRGVGSISLDGGSGSIRTSAGAIDLTAGQDITVGSGYINTTGGGSISAHALAGSINTGTYAIGYAFQGADTAAGGYGFDSGGAVGGISTMAGGNVNLTAGGNIISQMPRQAVTEVGSTAGCGAYGFQSGQAGDVNIVAGGDVTGNYLVANGTGRIYAGVLMDAHGNPVTDGGGNYVLGNSGNAGTGDNLLSLNLVSGGWKVNAGNNINLMEVRNPNGDFNSEKSDDNGNEFASYHAFNYAPSDYVDLTAGNGVNLGPSLSAPGDIPRVGDGIRVPIIYPGILHVTAGAGGVTFTGSSTYKQLILFPSRLGSLIINTTDGGSLVGGLPNANNGPQVFNITISDSGRNQYDSTSTTLFGPNDHAATPIHAGSETPVELNISGDMNLVQLNSPEAAQINVVGNMKNSWVQAMNLKNTDTTSIDVGEAAKISMENSGILDASSDGSLAVGGDIVNRSAFTSVDLNSVPGFDAPDLSKLVNISNVDPSVSLATLELSLFYNSTTKVFTYENVNGLSIQKLVSDLEDPRVGVLKPDSTTGTALENEYLAEGAIPSSVGNYTLGGGGTFAFNAANLDLGTTAGILTKGFGYYTVQGAYPLASLFNKGANIDINLTGSLTMYSSAIATLDGGNITVDADGSVNVGSSAFNVTALGPRGIFSTGHGNVTVIAQEDVNVNGSRIAAYDGGNVTVESVHGNIDAGTGGAGFVVVSSFGLSTGTQKHRTRPTPITITETIPGSGILATTFPNDIGEVVGNILVEAPNGTVNASSGGIVQLPLNGVNQASSVVDVLAGYELRDSSGNPVTASNLGQGTPVQVSPGRDINASGSGVIGSTVKLRATGNVSGAIFARNNIDISAQQNVNVTALAQGTINVSSGGSISGTLIGVGGISASGGSIDASLESNNSISGDTSGSKGMAAGTAANAASEAASANDAANAQAKSDTSEDDDLLKKKKTITLARKISRVTVLLPDKK